MRDTWELCGFENGRFFSLLSLNCSVWAHFFSTPMRKNNPSNTEIPDLQCCEESLNLNPAFLCVASLRHGAWNITSNSELEWVERIKNGKMS